MKNPVSSNLSAMVLGVSAAMAGNAMAHPGQHGSGAAANQWLHDVVHFFISIDHVAPVIACVMIVLAYRHRCSLAALAKKRHGRKSSAGH